MALNTSKPKCFSDYLEWFKINKNLNKSLSQDYSNVVKKINKFRVLKSNVMVDGVRYKISVSFLLLC